MSVAFIKFSSSNLEIFMKKSNLLYISTSVWMLRTPNAGRNSNFQPFFCKKPEKRKKFAANSSKKQGFLSLHQNAGRLFFWGIKQWTSILVQT